MKPWLCLAVAVAFAVLLVGCEPQISLFPLFTQDDKVFDKQLLGEWQIWSGTELKPGDTPGSIIFSASKEAYTYDVRIPNFDEDHRTLSSEARLVKLGNYVFVDFGTPDVDKLPQIPYPAVEGHAFGRLTLEGDKGRIDLLNDEWVKDSTKAGKMSLAFQDASRVVLSAGTSDLRKFALEHAEDHGAFSQTYTLARKKAAE